MANAPARPTALADSLLLVSHVVPAGGMGYPMHPTAKNSSTKSRTRAGANGRLFGQSNRARYRYLLALRAGCSQEKKGKKRHIIVDTLGNLLVVLVSSADIQDQLAGRFALEQLRTHVPSVVKVWADKAYKRDSLPSYARDSLGIDLEITEKKPEQKGFVPIQQRWKVERAFGWMSRYRRLSKDVERTTSSSRGFVLLAMANRLLQSLHPPQNMKNLPLNTL